MQDLEPELQEAWEDAGWDLRSKGFEQEDINGSSFKGADVLLTKLAHHTGEVMTELEDAFGPGVWLSEEVQDIWMLAGWKLPDSCAGVPWYDGDVTEDDRFDSSEMVRQVSPAFEFDPPEMLREVVQDGSFLRQVSCEGDKYMKTEESNTMLQQISTEMRQQLSDGVALKRQIESGAVCTPKTPKVGTSLAWQARTPTDDAGFRRQASNESRASGYSRTGEKTLPCADGHSDSSKNVLAAETERQPLRQLSCASNTSTVEILSPKSKLPVQGSLAFVIALGAQANGFIPRDEAATGPVLDSAIAKVLESMASQCTIQRQWTCFHARRAPHVSLLEYLTRIRTYLRCSDACMILSLVYINRLTTMETPLELSFLSCHRLLFTSILISLKFYDDLFPSSKYASCVFGVKLVELNSLEAEFLRLLNWKLYVKASEYKWFLGNMTQLSFDHTSLPHEID